MFRPDPIQVRVISSVYGGNGFADYVTKRGLQHKVKNPITKSKIASVQCRHFFSTLYTRMVLSLETILQQQFLHMYWMYIWSPKNTSIVVYFVFIWYIFPVWVKFTKKNLATLFWTVRHRQVIFCLFAPPFVEFSSLPVNPWTHKTPRCVDSVTRDRC
jgi:hypothetical protein